MMKILIAYSQKLLQKHNGKLSAVLDYAQALSQYCNIVTLNVDGIEDGLFTSTEAIENFLPDIIHCMDEESYFTFRYFRKILYSVQILNYKNSEKEKSALKYSSLCAFSSENELFETCKNINECAGIIIPTSMKTRQYIKTHLFYYYQIILHSNAELFASYNLSANRNFFRQRTTLFNHLDFFQQAENFSVMNFFQNLPPAKGRKMKSKEILVITDCPLRKNTEKTLRATFPRIGFLNRLQFMQNYLFFPNESLPFFDKSYDIVILSSSFVRKENQKLVESELKRISVYSSLKLSVQTVRIEKSLLK